jgi:hypothetical protein
MMLINSTRLFKFAQHVSKVDHLVPGQGPTIQIGYLGKQVQRIFSITRLFEASVLSVIFGAKKIE